jgi:hypothetical protein
VSEPVELTTTELPALSVSADLSTLLIVLLKGVIYREDHEPQWMALLVLQARVREYVSVLNLELILDEAEGYAFLKSKPELPDDQAAAKLPRLIARRPLSFTVSLLLALLRKKLAEFDAGAGLNSDSKRLILAREEIVDLLRVFMPDGSNDAKLIDQLEAQINKVVELGFLRRLKPSSSAQQQVNYEVRRILKAFVDAQWLAEFDARLSTYQAQLGGAELDQSAEDE